MKTTELAERIYDLWEKRDVDAVMALIPDDASVFIPGHTGISGDHEKSNLKAVLTTLASAATSGRYRQERVCRYESENGAMFVFDNFVTMNGQKQQYHSVHEWIVRDGRLRAVMVYLHEYDVFAKAWRDDGGP